MLLVETTVKPTPVGGLGLFAAQRLPKGTEVWKYIPGIDATYTREQIETFPELFLRFLFRHASSTDGFKTYMVPIDDTRYTNHSDHPNCKTTLDGNTAYTFQNVNIGDELTLNYEEAEEMDAEDDILVQLAKKLKVDLFHPRR